MNVGMFSSAGLEMFLRWVHYFAGVVWIGMLYYFNFVQGEWFKEIDATIKNNAFNKLVPRALKWFRYGALFTFLTGVFLLKYKYLTSGIEIFTTSWGIFILTGAAMGTIMFLNVWLIIWPSQKVLIQNAQNALEGKPAIADAPARAAKAGLASRTNVLFSIPLLFFMGAASHLPLEVSDTYSGWLLFAALGVIIGGLELNAIKGKLGPLTTIKGVTHCALALTIVLYAVIEIIC
ncbi:MAG: urate hydroxylase PuuD [Bacteriovoracaceae bacterium]